MTGFGRCEAVAGEKKITVEVRSLNGKMMDLALKMPQSFRAAEYDMRAATARVLVRGKAEICVTLDAGSSPGATVNAQMFAEYYRQIVEAGRSRGADPGFDPVLAAAVLRLPDVVGTSPTSASDDELTALRSALDGALAALDAFREHEGAILLADIRARVGTIENLLAQVEPYERARVEAVRKRIVDHLATLGVTADPNRLEQEIVFWVEKFDITEEKVRLAKHCDYFRQTADTDDDAGRKLGFIAQEMGREINTLGSKANDAEIQKIVVQMKDELEKIKEQLLNIL